MDSRDRATSPGNHVAEQRGDVVAICTRNRSEDLARALDAVANTANAPDVVIVDSSDSASSARNVTLARSRGAYYIPFETKPSLARQRNVAIEFSRHEGYNYIHFIDDDTVVQSGYFSAIRRTFEIDRQVAGVGGVVLNQDRPRFRMAKRLFLLDSKRPGVILRSGRNTIGHYAESVAIDPQWLPGCCMSYRISAVSGFTFDARKDGYSWGEDFDFSFRLSRRAKLRIAPDAKIQHMESPQNRVAVKELSRQRTVDLYKWVREHQADGMRVDAYAWSVVGEIILRGLSAILRRTSADADWAKGVALGALDVALPSTTKTKLGTSSSVAELEATEVDFFFGSVPLVGFAATESAAQVLVSKAKRRENGDVHLCNAFTFAAARDDAHLLKTLQQANLNLTDGTPLAWYGRIKSGRNINPVRGPGLMEHVLRLGVDEKISHFFYGSSEETLAKLTDRVSQRFPGLIISGAVSPPFRELGQRDFADLVDELKETQPHLVWIGLGTPKQDLVASHLAGSYPSLFVAVGAAFDFAAGTKREAPRFFQNSGLEWIFRLATEPRRLWRRYTIGNVAFLRIIFGDFRKQRKFRAEK